LEIALKNADFRVDSERVWRWETVQGGGYKAVIKFELLADLDDQPQSANVHFEQTDNLGAVNLRGTGYASKDYAPRTLVAYDQGARVTAEVNVTGLAGFLLAKTAAANGRHKAKDYYDIAFVLLHHNEIFDESRPLDPADVVLQRLGVPVELRTAVEDLAANFSPADPPRPLPCANSCAPGHVGRRIPKMSFGSDAHLTLSLSVKSGSQHVAIRSGIAEPTMVG
jgi:hypothetical protein